MALSEAWLGFAGYLGCLLIPYCGFLVVYRLLFHPLRNYPGPFLAGLTDAYAGYYALKRSLHLATFEDHLKYGNVMRYGPNRLIFNTPTALREIYQNSRVTKSNVYLFAQLGEAPLIFSAIDKETHLRKRKVIAPVLSTKSMKMFEPVMSAQVDVFLNKILQAGDQEHVDMSEACRRLTMDVAARLGFGYPLSFQTTDEHDFVLTGTSAANWRLNSYMNFPALSNLYIHTIQRALPVRQKWHSLVAKMVSARLSEDKHARHDLYSYAMGSLQDDSENIRHTEIFVDSLFFLSAGGDTLSTAIAGLFFYLSRNPRCYEILKEEIRSEFQSGTDITGGPKLAKCRYLRACIDETLRMSPPIGGTLWRNLAAREDGSPLIIDGHVIPPGTLVGVNTYALHHTEEYFPDPFTFKPERWFPKSGQGLHYDDDELETVPYANYATFAPFSVGSRSCAGKPMAYLEASLVAAKTLFYFDFARGEGPLSNTGSGTKGATGGRGRVDEFQLYDVFTSRHAGPHLKFTPRGAGYMEELREHIRIRRDAA